MPRNTNLPYFYCKQVVFVGSYLHVYCLVILHHRPLTTLKNNEMLIADFLNEETKRTVSGVNTKLTEDEVLIIDALVKFREARGLTNGKAHLTRQMIQFCFDHDTSTFCVPKTKAEKEEFNLIIAEIQAEKLKDNNEHIHEEENPANSTPAATA